ncbi:MAG TPA: hypothetical protein V6C84_00690 [Coleofasciculaceae cyanobacterium]|jgi:DNA-binding transcriptional MerR regulator
MHTTQTRAIQGFTFEQVRSEVERVRRKRLPPRTLQHWLSHLPISRDDNGCYSQEDIEILKALCRWLRKPGNRIQDFSQLIQQEYQSYAH